jgi:replicative DNA helicase
VNYPQAIDIEEVVLGAILLEPEAAHRALPIINEQCFFHVPNQIIFRCVSYLYKNNMPIDMLTVVNQLKANGYLQQVGGPYYVSQLTSKVASSANIEAHARILYQKFLQRRLIDISQNNLAAAQNETCDVFELIDSYEKNLSVLTTGIVGDTIESSATIHQQMLERNKILLTKKGMSGITSGFTGLDSVTSGWQEPDFIIIAARPAMGKSSLAAQLVTNPAINQGKPVALFTLEMSTMQFYARMQAQQSGINVEKILRTGLDDNETQQLNTSCQNLINAPIYIDDTPSISIFNLRNKARKLKREKGIAMIVIDYLQLMTAENKGGNREQEIGLISRSLKALAKELKIPIIALSQLSRDVEKRADKRPQLSDLRESGSLEMDTDLVAFLYRPEYYGIMQDEQGNSTAGKSLLIIAKHRNGSLADIPLNFEHAKTKFSDYQSNNYIYNNY